MLKHSVSDTNTHTKLRNFLKKIEGRMVYQFGMAHKRRWQQNLDQIWRLNLSLWSIIWNAKNKPEIVYFNVISVSCGSRFLFFRSLASLANTHTRSVWYVLPIIIQPTEEAKKEERTNERTRKCCTNIWRGANTRWPMTRHGLFYVTPFESNSHACAVHAVCESKRANRT